MQVIALGFLFVFIAVNPARSFPRDDYGKNQSISLSQCQREFIRRGVQECCKIPKQRIWGDLGNSFEACASQIKPEKLLAKTDKTMTPSPNYPVTDKTTVVNYKAQNETKLMDTNGKRRKYNRREIQQTECLMECVFEREGFLADKKLNKKAIAEQLKLNIGDDKSWSEIMSSASKNCVETDFGITTNSSCKSGADYLFQCVLKEIFWNCPTWPNKNEYCTSLRDSYQKCPEGSFLPPPSEDSTQDFPDAESAI